MTNYSDQDPINDFPPHWKIFFESLKRKPPRNNGIARINWGRGRLVPFSSQASFIAQFCALNDLKLPALEGFFDSYFGVGTRWQLVFTDKDLLPMAKLLDEPHAVVQTLFNNFFQLPVCFGEFRMDFSEIKPEKYVSYCPQCLASGYHSAFHEAPWLYLCLLHRVPLIRVPVGAGHAEYPNAVADLLRGACGRWPDVWMSDFDLDGSPQLAQAKSWLAEAGDCAMRLSSQNIAMRTDKSYSFDDLDILLGRLDSLVPIPGQIIDYLITPPRRQQQSRDELSRDAVIKLKSVSNNVPLRLLLWYFGKYHSILSSPRPSRLLAGQVIAELEHEHAVCRCDWAWDRYIGWRPIWDDEKRSDRLLCPYQYAINELEEHWLVFALPEESPQTLKKIISRFLEGTKLVLENGLGHFPESPIDFPPGSGFSKAYLLPELTFGDDFEYMLDSLLVAQTNAHIEDLTTWLSEVSHDKKPIRKTPAGSVNLFSDESAAWVSAWKSLEAKSAYPLARWEEGVLRWTSMS